MARDIGTVGATGVEPAAVAAPRRRTRHATRERGDRGTDTRARLIEAGLDVFGRLGFEGASTRAIAEQAGANLAAIVYHFGSKEALHVAVAEAVAGRILALVGPSLASAAAPDATATPDAARATLLRLLDTYAEVILGEAEAERWARFIVREQMQPTAAFEAIYRIMGGAHGTASRLVAAALGHDPADAEVRLRVFALMGQVLVFRVAQALVLRRMEWAAIGEAERAAIRRIVRAQTEAILGGAA